MERPVMTREQLLSLGQRLLAMSSADIDIVNITVSHTANIITRLAHNRVLTSDDGERLTIQIETMVGGPPVYTVITNQWDDRVLAAGLRQCEALLRASPSYKPDSGMKHEEYVQDAVAPVQLWHDTTIGAMQTTRETVIPAILDIVRQQKLHAAGFVGLMARSEAVIRKDGSILLYHDETDSELTVTAVSQDGKNIGWGGQAARDWSQIKPAEVTQHAMTMATLGGTPVAVEPGKRTAILTPAAVAQLLRYFAGQWHALNTNQGQTALSKSRMGGNKLRQRIMDQRFTMSSDPTDPAGGYRPYVIWEGVASPAMTWVEHGVLTNLAFNMPWYAMERGTRYAALPNSFRLSGGTTSIEEMIAQCPDGILVNRFSDVDLLDEHTCLLTGVTQGGCFLVRDGKVSKAIKNLRFMTSPFFFLNNVEALGVTERAAFGYTPLTQPEYMTSDGFYEWPRQPVIVPPMMVRDFNFSAVADAV